MVWARTTARLGTTRIRVVLLSVGVMAGCGQLIDADFEQRAEGCRDLETGRWRETCSANGDLPVGGVASHGGGDAGARATDEASGNQAGRSDGGAGSSEHGSGGHVAGPPGAGATLGGDESGAGAPAAAGAGGAGGEGGAKPDENPPGALEVAFEGPAWPTKLVKVCWSDQLERPEIATRVEWLVRDTWGRSAGLRLAGWSYCPENAGWLSVELNAGSEGDIDGVGVATGLRHISLGINMPNFDAAVVHLFGHALGFTHGKLGSAKDVAAGACEASDVAGEPSDYWERSVMSPHGHCGVAELGAPDVELLQRAYGRKGSGALVSLGNRCMDIKSDEPILRDNLQIFECNYARNQSWYRDTDARLFVAHAPGLAADVAVGAATRFLQLFPLNKPATPNQQFSLGDGQLRALGDSCLGMPGDGDASVQAGPCARFGSQSWQMGADGRIKVDGACLTGPAPDAAAGDASPFIAACDQSARQVFGFSRLGQLRQGQSCLEVVDANDPAASRALRFASCRAESDPNRLSQQFYYRGRVLADAQCLHVTGEKAVDHALLETVACSGSDPSQRWDYYFTDPL